MESRYASARGDLAWLEKTRAFAATTLILYVPVPDNSITMGLDDALSSMVTVPDLGPAEVGPLLAKDARN